MKVILSLFILFTFAISSAYAGSCKHGRKIKGTVNDVFVGEIDESVFGNACVTFFKVEQNLPDGSTLLGIVENHLDCSIADKYLELIDEPVDTCITNLTLIESKSTLKVLKSFYSDAFYLIDTAN